MNSNTYVGRAALARGQRRCDRAEREAQRGLHAPRGARGGQGNARHSILFRLQTRFVKNQFLQNTVSGQCNEPTCD